MNKKEEYLALLRQHFGLNEAVDVLNSYEKLKDELEAALKKWPGRPADDIYIAFTFSDRIVAYSWDDDEGTAWEIPWDRSGDNIITFGEPMKVKRVVRFEPVSENRVANGRRITERVERRLALLPVDESVGANTGRRIKAIGITADVINENGRRYPRQVLAAAIAELNGHLHESAGQGRLILTGEAEHPSDKGGRPNILETVVKWEKVYLQENGQVGLEGLILPTQKGRDILVLIENGVPIGVSQRAYGATERIRENGQTVEEVRRLRITGYDLVADPSDPNGAIVESKLSKEGKKVSLEELLELLKEQPELAEAMMKRMGLASKKDLAEALGVDDPDQVETALQEAKQAQQELEERMQQEAVDAAIQEQTKELPYGDLNEAFVAAVREANPKTPNDVQAIVEAKRKEYDAIVAAARLSSMGRVKVQGPVFERETGQPEYTRPAWEITERLVKRGEATRHNLADPQTPGEIWAAQYLEAFDKAYRHQLMEESRKFRELMEAETTSDLNLPYSVSRAIIEEAVPELVAASVFDFGLTPVSPSRIYFEAYNEETGASASVTNESVTASLGGWVSLAHKELRPGTVVVTDSGGTTTYTENTDYVIDYAEGRLYALSGGSITNGQSLEVDYTYDAVREGENTEIQRGKGVLSYQDFSVSAMRLATQITDEAIAFSRSQLGWDAQAKTIGMLIREIREMIDRGVFRLAVAQSVISGNSGGSWNSSTGTLDDLVKAMGTAKVAVINDYYQPAAFVMSATNADRLSNWTGFKADGFPNAILNAAGFAGSVKGLPIFSSTQMPDSVILAVHRELVQHRVLEGKPMHLVGPFPTYSNGKLVAAQQWYVEEYNRTMSLIANKGGFVQVV